MTAPVLRPLRGIDPSSFQHPADRAATAALRSIPGLDALIRKLMTLRYDRAFQQSALGAAVRLGPEQLPHVWERHLLAADMLDLPQQHDLYLTHWPFANASAVGTGKAIVVVNSAALDLFDEEELGTVLAHEAGHILCEHVLYQTTLYVLLVLVPLGRIPALAGVPLVALRSALLEWARAAELSCDRAATLVNRDPLVTSRTLRTLAAGRPSRELDLNAFLRQAQDYHEWDNGWDRFARALAELSLTHGSPVRRVAELTAWVRSGEYDRIVGGSYTRRGEKADVRGGADAAFRHYRDRFDRIFREAGETASGAVAKVNDWLDRSS